MSGMYQSTARVLREITAEKASPRLRHVDTSLRWYEVARQLVVDVRTWYRSQWCYQLTVLSEDQIYPDVHRWLLGLLPREAHRSMTARSSLSWYEDWQVEDSRREHGEVMLGIDNTSEQLVMINGFAVRVSLIKGANPISSAADREAPQRFEPDRIMLAARTVAGQQMLVDELSRIVVEREAQRRRPSLWVATRYQRFEKVAEVPLRKLDTVVLAAGQAERLVGDIEEFLASEQLYARRGIPWHRGYLLHGPPGTGKTSLAKALAEHFRLDLWYLPLGDLTGDTNLLEMLGQVRKRSMLLIEDVDVWQAARSRETEKGELSLSGLLNALDGVATPHGLIKVATTNELAAIDVAVTRAGRFDVLEELDLPDMEQATRLFTIFYGVSPKRRISPFGRSAADLCEVMKRHMHDPVAAELMLNRKRVAA